MPKELPETLLVPVDEYMREHMSEGGAIHYADKQHVPRDEWLKQGAMIFIALAPYVAFTLLVAFDPMFLVICALIVLIVGFAWMVNPALRITITDTHLHVRQGLSGEAIPLQNIRSTEALDHANRRQEFRNGPALSATRRVLLNRAEGPAVRVHFNGPKGDHELVFGVTNAALATSTLDRLRGATPTAAPSQGHPPDQVVLDLERPAEADALEHAEAPASAHKR